VILVVLIMYFCGLLLAYGASSFVNETKILDIQVRYTISSHLASIIQCTTIFIYLLHLRGRNLNWAETKYKQLPTTEQTVQGVELTSDVGTGVVVGGV
jgi:hypothetical protein